jgi:hypothetical protein
MLKAKCRMIMIVKLDKTKEIWMNLKKQNRVEELYS